MTVVFSSLIALAAISSTTRAQNCGADCRGCADLASCDADPNCFYLVDLSSDGCRIRGECESDCSLCPDEASCATGAGGNCLFNVGFQECYGATCDTDCQNCNPLNDECISSRAPPFGCVPDSFEEVCVPATPTASPTPGMMTPIPTIIVTMSTDTMDTTDSESESSESDSMETTDFETTDSLSDSDSSDEFETSEMAMETTDSLESESGDSDSFESTMSDISTTDDESDSGSEDFETTDIESIEGESTDDDDDTDVESNDTDTDTDIDSADAEGAGSVDDDDMDTDDSNVVEADTSDSSDPAQGGDVTPPINVDTDSESGDGVEPVSTSDASTDGSTDDDDFDSVVEIDSDDSSDGSADSNDTASAFGHGGLTQSGRGSTTNIAGAVLAVCGVLAFLAIASGVWCYCKKKESAFVSLNVIDLEEHDEDKDDREHEHDEHTVMMTVVNEGNAITACSEDDEDIL